jgi:hypothetical protein
MSEHGLGWNFFSFSSSLLEDVGYLSWVAWYGIGMDIQRACIGEGHRVEYLTSF